MKAPDYTYLTSHNNPIYLLQQWVVAVSGVQLIYCGGGSGTSKPCAP